MITLQAMDNENTNRVLIELHKEIKKNGPLRSLKAALWRFSHLADLIRLPKRRQYLINFIPCIISMSRREEESIHEALMNSLPKILQSLGNFLSENDVKVNIFYMCIFILLVSDCFNVINSMIFRHC